MPSNETRHNGRRNSESWWIKTLITFVILGFIGQGVLTWRAVSVLENDFTHLSTAIIEMKSDIKDIWRSIYPRLTKSGDGGRI